MPAYAPPVVTLGGMAQGIATYAWHQVTILLRRCAIYGLNALLRSCRRSVRFGFNSSCTTNLVMHLQLASIRMFMAQAAAPADEVVRSPINKCRCGYRLCESPPPRQRAWSQLAESGQSSAMMHYVPLPPAPPGRITRRRLFTKTTRQKATHSHVLLVRINTDHLQHTLATAGCPREGVRRVNG